MEPEIRIIDNKSNKDENKPSQREIREKNLPTISNLYFNKFLPLNKEIANLNKSIKPDYPKKTEYNWTRSEKISTLAQKQEQLKNLLLRMIKLGYLPVKDDIKYLPQFIKSIEYKQAVTEQLNLGVIITKKELELTQREFSISKLSTPPKPITVDNFIAELTAYRDKREAELIKSNRSKHSLFGITAGIDYTHKRSALEKILDYLNQEVKDNRPIIFNKNEAAAIHNERLGKIYSYYQYLLPEIKIVDFKVKTNKDKNFGRSA